MDNCIFCKIINNQIPSATIYENHEFKVILDRFPGSEGHILILPKEHYADIFEIDSQKAGRLFSLAVDIGNAMKKSLNFQGMNVLQNNGEIAGQTVYHFHLHLIPRYENDTITIAWQPMEVSDEKIEEIRLKISKEITI